MSLIERRGAAFVADRRDCVRFEPGCIAIAGLPVGTYDLAGPGLHATLHIEDGPAVAGWIVGRTRRLTDNARPPPLIADLSIDDGGLRIVLAHADETARVHVVGTRLQADPTVATLGRPRPDPQIVPHAAPVSRYLANRDIGDEHRYVVERRFAAIRSGNALPRPGLLLNPWARDEVPRTSPPIAPGEAWQVADPEPEVEPAEPAPPPPRPEPPRRLPSGANLDFLASAPLLAANLAPSADGVVVLPRAELEGSHEIWVLATGAAGETWRRLRLPEAPLPTRDLRHRGAAPAGAPRVVRRVRRALGAGEALSIADPIDPRYAGYASLGAAHRLLALLCPDDLSAFAFLARWGATSARDKRDLYGQHACHELALFCARKDGPFFDEVIAPYLANKHHKTFMDRYLLGEDLAPYARPAAFARLNVVERILLGQRLPALAASVERHLAETYVPAEGSGRSRLPDRPDGPSPRPPDAARTRRPAADRSRRGQRRGRPRGIGGRRLRSRGLRPPGPLRRRAPGRRARCARRARQRAPQAAPLPPPRNPPRSSPRRATTACGRATRPPGSCASAPSGSISRATAARPPSSRPTSPRPRPTAPRPCWPSRSSICPTTAPISSLSAKTTLSSCARAVRPSRTARPSPLPAKKRPTLR